MIKTMNYVNLSELGAAIDAKYITDFIFFWDTENSEGAFLSCDEEKLKDLIEYVEYLEKVNSNLHYLQKAKNEINAINLLRTKYGITDKIFVYFD